MKSVFILRAPVSEYYILLASLWLVLNGTGLRLVTVGA